MRPGSVRNGRATARPSRCSRFGTGGPARIAGSTVREPATAAATTTMVAVPTLSNTAWPARYMPAIAPITVRPDTRTARPEVAAATSTASRRERPAARSERWRVT